MVSRGCKFENCFSKISIESINFGLPFIYWSEGELDVCTFTLSLENHDEICLLFEAPNFDNSIIYVLKT